MQYPAHEFVAEAFMFRGRMENWPSHIYGKIKMQQIWIIMCRDVLIAVITIGTELANLFINQVRLTEGDCFIL